MLLLWMLLLSSSLLIPDVVAPVWDGRKPPAEANPAAAREVHRSGTTAADAADAADAARADRWAPSWAMNDSTLIFWRNATGLQPVADFAGYGVVMLDWAHAAGHWINDYSPMSDGAALAEQCRLIKATFPRTRCVVYRNSVKALNQFADVGAKVDSEAHSGFFLSFRTGATSPSECWCTSVQANKLICYNSSRTDVHVPMCDGADRSKCNERLYHDSRQIPHVPGKNWMNDTLHPFENLSCTRGPSCDCGVSPCGEYLFDHRNRSLREWMIRDYFGGKDCLGSDDIDGLILDDFWYATGPTEENSAAVSDMGLSSEDVAHIQGNWSLLLQDLSADVSARGKYIMPTYAGDSMSTRSHNHTQCAQRMRQLGCMPGTPETGPMLFTVRFNHTPTEKLGLTPIDATLDVAYYLLGRGPVAWIGSGYILGWALSLQYNVPAHRPITVADIHVDLFERDYGVPLGRCEETSPGSEIFVRQWSKATVKLDCVAFKGSITMVKNDQQHN